MPSQRNWLLYFVIIALVIAGGVGGYFIWKNMRASADVPVSSTGTSDGSIDTATVASSTKLTVKEGWNFVAFPYNTVTTVTALKAKLPTTVEAKIVYRYSSEGSWVNVEDSDSGTLKPGTGYLVYFKGVGTIDLDGTVSGGKDYRSAQVPLVSGKWQLVGLPLVYATKWQESAGSTTQFVPDTGVSIKLKDGSTKSMLAAVSEGYLTTPLFLENQHPNYSYVKLYDLSTTALPYFGSFWVKPKSTEVESIIFTTSGQAASGKITLEELKIGEDLTVPAAP